MDTLVQIQCESVREPEPPAENGHSEPAGKSAAKALRASSYIIYVDLPNNREEMLLVHGYTGAYDKVSRSLAGYIRSLEVRRPPKPLYGDWGSEPVIESSVPPASPEDIQLLQKRGYLTRMAVEEEENFFYRVATKMHERRLTQMPSYIIMPTYDCNLRCSYCFQDHMRTDPKFSHLLRPMSNEVVERIFASMKKIETLHGIGEDGFLGRHRSIGFLAANLFLLPIAPRSNTFSKKLRKSARQVSGPSAMQRSWTLMRICCRRN